MAVPLRASDSPEDAARRLLAERGTDPNWLDAFGAAMDAARTGASLRRVLSVWGLSQSEFAEMHGVTRQAVSKWQDRGVPAERAALVADLAAATDLLVRYLQRDRIPAVVRRPAANLGGRSLLELVADGRSADALAACRAMFDVSAVPG